MPAALYRLAFGVFVLTLATTNLSRVASAETVYLIPEDRASFRAANAFAWLRPGHNYGDRKIAVTTTPNGALLDLFYVRSNFQKRYEQAESPAIVVLPKRAEAGPRDAVTIRAFMEGYRQKEVSVRVSSRQDSVHIALESLPNMLVAASHTYFAGRASLQFLTKESLTVRVQDLDEGFRVILAETAKGPEIAGTLDAVRSPLIEQVDSLQLGEDLLVRVITPPAVRESGLKLRSRQSRDELRNLYAYSVEMVPADGGAQAVMRAKAALASLRQADAFGCASRFDETLRAELDPAKLSRALAPRGSFTDPYLREAMKRLGQVSPGGSIEMLDGSRFRPGSPIELAAAMSQPADAIGYLALLRAFVSDLEALAYRRETLRSLMAPELGAVEFAAAVDSAEAAESSCIARS